jgi:hypothetical protein
MCNNCKSCKGCSGTSNADGSKNYDPSQVVTWIQKYLMPNASLTDVKAAYPKVMVYLDVKNLPVSEESISSHSDEIGKAINDPNFLENLEKSHSVNYKPLLAIVVISIVIIVFIQRA